MADKDIGELNAKIAEALGWRVWQDSRQRWFMERQGAPGKIEVAFIPDYISILRNDVKMRVGDD
jgi:hypothetical protein